MIADGRIQSGDSEVSQQVLQPKKNPHLFYVTICNDLQIGMRQSSSLLFWFVCSKRMEEKKICVPQLAFNAHSQFSYS